MDSFFPSQAAAGLPFHLLWVCGAFCQYKESGFLFTCIVVVWQLLKSKICVFLLCLENIFLEGSLISFKTFSLAIGVQPLLTVCLHGDRVSIFGVSTVPICLRSGQVCVSNYCLSLHDYPVLVIAKQATPIYSI